MIRTLVAALCAAVLSAGAAAAQTCADLPTDPRLPPPGADFRAMQNTLAIALGRDISQTPRLDDGVPGDTTSEALVELCTAVPVAGDQTPADATLDLIVEYAALSGAFGDVAGDETWFEAASALATSGRLTGADGPPLALRLAGPVSMTAAALAGSDATADCTGQSAADLPADAAAGLDALATADPPVATATDRLAQVCARYPVAGGPSAIAAALARFDRLERARDGALATLADPDFAAWLIAGAAESPTDAPEARLRRLAGTVPAVLRLLDDHAGETGAPLPPEDQTLAVPSPAQTDLPPPQSCAPNPGALTYTSFTEADATRLTQARQVRPPLQGISDTFDSEAALLDAIFAALGPDLSACVRDSIARITGGPQSPARVFRLDAQGVESLAFAAEIAAAQPVIEGLIGRLAPSEAALLDGAEAAVRTAVSDAVAAEVELAAETVAGAAEPLPPLFDLAPEGLPDFDIEQMPASLAITDLTDATLAATLENEAFVEAIEQTDFPTAPNAEVLKGDVRRALNPVAQEQIAATVDTTMARLARLVDAQWAVTPDLVEAIAGIPQLVESFAVPEAAVQKVVGVSYPNQRLMAQAFRDSGAPPDPDAFARAMQLATKTVEDTLSARATGDFATEDCGCVSRREEHSLVYAFYPFWLSPILPDPATAPQPADGSGDGAPPPPPAPQPIDFVLTERVAFWGIEMVRPETGGAPALRHDHHWSRMKEGFIASAHRHRARADVSVYLRGWQDWTDAEIPDAVGALMELAAPYDRFEDLSLTTLRNDLPTLLDRPRADGITLMFEGYTGRGAHPDAARLIQIVRLVADAAAARNVDLFLALDPPVVDQTIPGGILDDLEPLFADDRMPFRNIMMFLERPTTDAKKIIRFRMENGVYRGKVRQDLLRRIVPVLPPGGHENVFASGIPPEDAPYSQFRDDLVYFQDNFGGLGLWPVADPGVETHREAALETMAQFDRSLLFPRLQHWEKQLAAVCTVVCPNRIYFGAVATVLALVTGGLVARSFYTGFANRLAFKMGFAWIGTGVLLVLLTLLTVCDQHADIAPWLLYALLAFLAAILIFNTYQAARDGPKP